jgi:two-component system, response regulator RegA
MNAIDRPSRVPGADGLAAPLQGLSEAERTLLIVDDDAPLNQRLARAMERRGFIVQTADSVATGIAAATADPPAFAVVDLRLSDGSGLDVVSALREARPGARIVMLTGYGNIADAVERALLALEGETPEPPEDPMSADRVRWEHIQRIFELCERNVSETARRLKMHRRTLQRILSKHAPRS